MTHDSPLQRFLRRLHRSSARPASRRIATIAHLTFLAFSLAFVAKVRAQEETPPAEKPSEPGGSQIESLENSPRQQVITKFERDAPQLGEPLPNLKLLDAEGQDFELARLRGHPTVLVFGCLT